MKIQFESTTACNARCTFCPRYDMTRPQGEMSDELFRKIVKDGKQMRKAFFVPFLNGEPFMFPRIWEWLDYLQAERCRVHIYTNAERVNVDRLVKYNNISVICCGVNAATKDTYDRVVRGPDFGLVVSNVKEIIKKARCKVFASMVVVDGNYGEIEKFTRMWAPHHIFGEFKNWGGARHCKLELVGDRVPCWALLNTMSILWDGRVVPCCLDFDGKQILGDANVQTLTEIWHQSQWMRRRHRRLDFDMDPCQACNSNIT